MRTFCLKAIAFLEKLSWLPLLISRLLFASMIGTVLGYIGVTPFYSSLLNSAHIPLLIIGIGIALGLFTRVMFGAAILLSILLVSMSGEPIFPTLQIPTLVCLSMIILGPGKASVDTIIAKKVLKKPLEKKSLPYACSSTLRYLNALRWLPLLLLRFSIFMIILGATTPFYSITDIILLSTGGIYLLGLFTRIIAFLPLIPLILIREQFGDFISFVYIIALILLFLITMGPGKLSIDALIKWKFLKKK